METSYKEKYEQALAKAKEQYNYPCMRSCIGILEEIFPELAESEDERIRKGLVRLLKELLELGGVAEDEWDRNECEKYIAWLEKQKVLTTEEDLQGKEDVLWCIKQAKKYAKNENEMGTCWFAEKWMEKQCEQETLCDKCKKAQPSHSCQDITELGRCAVEHEQKPVDKVEPKFKIGDWLVHNERKHIIKVVNPTPMVYEVVNILGYHHTITDTAIENNYHLWTIQDAKDGDVLFMDNGVANCIFIYKSSNNGIINKYASYNKFGFEGEHYLVLNDGYVIPATKEQRDTLERAITNAGYRWDKEKLKLEKI